MTAYYIFVRYGYSIWGYDRFWFDCQNIIYGIHIGKYERREPHVIVSVIGIFKREGGDHMNLLSLRNVTQSGIMIQVWFDRLVALLKV